MPVIINGSTGISGTDGSAGTPAVQGTDTNTGMFFPAADQIAFAEGGVEAMRLDANGRVGIGTSSPAVRLDVSGDVRTNGTVQINKINSALDIRPGAADFSSVVWRSDNGLTTYANMGPDTAGSGSLWVNGATNIFLATGGSERARITSGGNFGIGTLAPETRLDVAGRAKANASLTGGFTTAALEAVSNSGNVGIAIHCVGASAVILRNERGAGDQLDVVNSQQSAWSNVRALGFSTMSDYRAKENIVPLTDAAKRVLQLPVYRFNFVEGSMSYEGGRTVDGFLAHEVAPFVPEAVTGGKDAVKADGSPLFQSLDHSKLVPLLTAALQEALTEIAALKARVAALEAR